VAKNRRKTSGRKTRLNASIAVTQPSVVPKRWVKFLIGLFLLAPAWVLTETFFSAFARTAIHDAFWATAEFWFFSMGVLLWLVMFFGLPKPLWLYVFGHELTHAVWVLLMGGRVHQFHVTKEGGHILADKTNTWIALAPYFFPIYSILAIAIYGLASLFVNMVPYREVLYAAIGATWAFHLTFTCWMIAKGQPDLAYGGTLFSLVIIYLCNLVLMAVMLILSSPGISWIGFGTELLDNAVDFSSMLTDLVRKV
jgi:hypothetical protein